MIHILVQGTKDNIQSLEAKGHALMAAYGKDVVCAGASAILIGACNALDMQFPDKCRLEVSPGHIVIGIEESDRDLQRALDFLLIQLETMVQKYPQYIQIKWKEV